MARHQARVPIIGFIHCYTVNNWRDILLEQQKKIEESGLYSRVDKIYIGCVGPKVEVDSEFLLKYFTFADKYEIMFHLPDPEINDSLTLAMMHQKAQTFNGSIFYIHSKGVSHNSNPAQVSWRRYMEYFIVERYETCLYYLSEVDLVGVNWRTHKGQEKSKIYGELVYQPITPHFSGNFFWANANYIKTLPRIFPIKGRYDCEFWAGRGNPRVAQMKESGIKHHRAQYPRINYENRFDITHYRGGQLEA